MAVLKVNQVLASCTFVLIIFLGSAFLLRPLWLQRDYLLEQKKNLFSLKEGMQQANRKYSYYQQLFECLKKEKSQLIRPGLKMGELQELTNVAPLNLIDVKPTDFDAQSVEISLHGSYSNALRYVQKQFLQFGNIHLIKFHAQHYSGVGLFTIVWGVNNEVD